MNLVPPWERGWLARLSARWPVILFILMLCLTLQETLKNVLVAFPQRTSTSLRGRSWLGHTVNPVVMLVSAPLDLAVAAYWSWARYAREKEKY